MSFRILLTIFLFVIRAFATGVFQAIFLYTPEVYPTTVRSFALGTCSAAARIGAIITPYTAQVSFLSHSCNIIVMQCNNYLHGVCYMDCKPQSESGLARNCV